MGRLEPGMVVAIGQGASRKNNIEETLWQTHQVPARARWHLT